MKKEDNFPLFSSPCSILMIALLAFAALLLVVQAGPSFQSQDTMRKTLSVSGTSELSVAPDEAQVFVSIITDNADAKQAQQANSITSNAVISALKSFGLTASDIETSTYSLVRKSDWDPKENRYIEGDYRLTHTLKVTTRQIEVVGEIVDTAVNAGANTIEGITFTLTKESESQVRDQALTKAAQVARQKAQALASSSGATLGKVTIVEEQNFIYRPFNYAMKADSAGASAPTEISPQNVDVSSSVHLVFDIK